MEPIFTLPYSEYEVARKLSQLLKKHGYSVYIPASRQQKGVDLIINKDATNKVARVQIKASCPHEREEKKYAHYLWFNNFEGRCKEGDADFYIFFGLYSQYSPRKNIDSEHYEPVFLCFKEREMLRFLAGARTKKGKRDSFFSFGFDSPERIYETRREEKPNVSEFLLERQINKIKIFLDKGIHL